MYYYREFQFAGKGSDGGMEVVSCENNSYLFTHKLISYKLAIIK